MSFTEEEWTEMAKEMAADLRRMANAQGEYARFGYLSQHIRQVWRKAAWLIEEMAEDRKK